MQQIEAVFENGVFRPLSNYSCDEGQIVKLIIEPQSIPKKQKKSWPSKGIIAKLTASPLVIPDFQPLTRNEANERW